MSYVVGYVLGIFIHDGSQTHCCSALHFVIDYSLVIVQANTKILFWKD